MMLMDLLFAMRRGWDELRAWRHTYSPLSPWRRQIAAVVDTTTTEAARYGIRSPVDRRRAYQIARMLVANRRGEHLVDVVPDAYLEYSPPSAATFHAGRRSYDPPAERLAKFRAHPQTLAYLLTPPRLARLGLGASQGDGLVVVASDEAEVNGETVVRRLQEASDGNAADADLRAYAEVILRLHAGVPAEQEPEEEAQAA